MIKLTNFIRDVQNPDNVIATIEFDINGVDQTPFDVDAPMVMVEPMTIDQVKDYIRTQVAIKRGEALWSSINGKLDIIKNIDLEVVP